MLWAIASVAWTAPRDTVLVLPSATLACVRGRHQACVSPQYAWFIEAFAGERYSRVLLFFLVGFSAPCVWFVVPYMHPMTLYASSHFVRKMRMAHMHTQHPCRHRCVAQYGVAAMLGTNVACARTTAALISSVSLLHTSRTWTYSVSRLFTSITATSFADTGTSQTEQRCEFFSTDTPCLERTRTLHVWEPTLLSNSRTDTASATPPRTPTETHWATYTRAWRR